MRTRVRRLRFTPRWFRFHLSKAARSAKNAHLFIRSKGEIFVAFVISFAFGSCVNFSPCVLKIATCKVRSSVFNQAMNQRLIAEIGRTQRLEILNSLKRTRGMSVNELVERMKMSYMGIKQHCLTLQRDGYLDTWRRPQKMGRPEMVYRLTRRSHDLFQADSNQFTIELLK